MSQQRRCTRRAGERGVSHRKEITMENLYNQFIKALQDTTDIAPNNYLTHLKNAVEQVSNASEADQVLSAYNQDLLSIVMTNNFALDPAKTNEFSQIIGEAHFYLLCKNKGVSLTRIKESEEKSPDFKLEPYGIHFEVKTLSVVSGGSGIRKSLEDSLDAQIDIERQLKQGKRIATGLSVVQPYGEKPYEKSKGTITVVVETLIEKTRHGGQLGTRRAIGDGY